ncbi:MAG: sigma-70 family RNA polymerase sigma factor [Erysipelotrichaceae bacterium]|nr:sigma-70 family RNA polymerase sigma factor [Erysipelotrichaceae bacterium]
MNEKILVNLIKENKNLIYSIINKYIRYYEFDDLYQVSIIGIIKAYQNYQEERQVKFTTYAYKYILSEVIAYVNSSKMIKTSREYNRLYKKILEARTILTQKIMKNPSIHELALFLEIDEAMIEDVIRYQESVKSLDEVIVEDGKKLTLLDQISSESYNIDIDTISLKEGLATLTKEEQELINLRYFEDRTQSEIANFFGTNQVQISRNEQKVLKKLKNNLCGTL